MRPHQIHQMTQADVDAFYPATFPETDASGRQAFLARVLEANRRELEMGDVPLGDAWKTLIQVFVTVYVTEHREQMSASALAQENQILRRLLAQHACKGLLYTDDGELSDATEYPSIDYIRHTAEQIRDSLQRRAQARYAESQIGQDPLPSKNMLGFIAQKIPQDVDMSTWDSL